MSSARALAEPRGQRDGTGGRDGSGTDAGAGGERGARSGTDAGAGSGTDAGGSRPLSLISTHLPPLLRPLLVPSTSAKSKWGSSCFLFTPRNLFAKRPLSITPPTLSRQSTMRFKSSWSSPLRGMSSAGGRRCFRAGLRETARPRRFIAAVGALAAGRLAGRVARSRGPARRRLPPRTRGNMKRWNDEARTLCARMQASQHFGAQIHENGTKNTAKR